MLDTEHRQVWLPAVEAYVDEGIANVLEFLASRGLRTVFSCQGSGHGRGYILFARAADMEAAVTMLAEVASRSGDVALHARILDLPEARVAGTGVVWELDARTQVSPTRGGSVRRPAFDYMISFPASDASIINELCVPPKRVAQDAASLY